MMHMNSKKQKTIAAAIVILICVAMVLGAILPMFA